MMKDNFARFMALDALDKTSEAELADVRVGADGTTYENAGTAVRTQIGELKEDLGELEITWFDGKYVFLDGSIKTESTYSYAEIDVSSISNVSIMIKTYLGYFAKYGFYDENNSIIKVLPSESVDRDIYTFNDVVPSNATKLRISCETSRKNYFNLSVSNVMYTLGNNLFALKKNLTIEDINYSVVENYFINESGGTTYLSGYNCSDYVYVVPNSVVQISHVFLNVSSSIAFYDENKNFVSIFDETGISEKLNVTVTVTVPSNCCYIRWSFNSSYNPIAKYISDVMYFDGRKEYEDTLTTLKDIENKYRVKYKNLFNTIKKPVISIVDDDSNATYIPALKALCDSKGIKMSFGVIYTLLQSNSNLLELLKTYQSEGFHIMNHPDIDNGKWQESSSTYDIAFAENHIVKSISYLKTQGFIDCEHIVSPGGAHGMELQEVYKKWCDSAIGYNNNAINVLNGDGKYDIHRVFIDANHDLNFYKNKIDAAYSKNGWLIIGTHSWEVVPSETLMQLLSDVIDYAISKGMEFKTYNRVIKDRTLIYDFYRMF